MKHRLLFLVCALALPSAALWAADSLITWSGEVRIRGEADGRDFQNSTPPNLYAQMRTRLGALVQPVHGVSVFLQIQDSRLFGQPLLPGSANTGSNYANIDLHQGYISLRSLVADDIDIRFGRMELAYDNERLVGVGDWSNVGRVFDGALVRYGPDGHVLDLFVTDIVDYSAVPQPVTPSTVAGAGSEGFLFSGAHYANTVLKDLAFSLYGFHEWSREGNSPAEIDRSRLTLGGRFKGGTEGAFADAEGAYQFGTLDGRDVAAFMGLAAAGLNLSESIFRSVSAGFEYLSGTPTGSSKVESFDPVFASPHKFFGIMDYFTVIPVQTLGGGLQDIYLRLVLGLSKDVTVTLVGHDLRLAKERLGGTQLGKEIDLLAQYGYKGFLLFELGGGVFLPDDVMKSYYGGEDPGLWGYGTVRVKF